MDRGARYLMAGAVALGSAFIAAGTIDLRFSVSKRAGTGTTGFNRMMTDLQGNDVYRHLMFGAGATILQNHGVPGGSEAFNYMWNLDVDDLTQGKTGAATELINDGASRVIGDAITTAIWTRSFSELRTTITKTICK